MAQEDQMPTHTDHGTTTEANEEMAGTGGMMDPDHTRSSRARDACEAACEQSGIGGGASVDCWLLVRMATVKGGLVRSVVARKGVEVNGDNRGLVTWWQEGGAGPICVNGGKGQASDVGCLLYSAAQ